MEAGFSSSLIEVRMRERSCMPCCQRQQRPMSFGTHIFIVYSALLSFSFVCKFFPDDCILHISRMFARFRKMRICSRCGWLAESPLFPLTPWWRCVARGSTSRILWICEGTDGLRKGLIHNGLLQPKKTCLLNSACTFWRTIDFSRGWFRTGA